MPTPAAGRGMKESACELSVYVSWRSLFTLVMNPFPIFLGKKLRSTAFGNHSGLCVTRGDADSFACKKEGGDCAGQRRDDGRREADRLLRLSIGHSAGRPAAERGFSVVVGRSRGRPHYGAYYREGGD